MINRNFFLIVCSVFLLNINLHAAPVRSLGDLNKVKGFSSIPFNTQSGSKIFFNRGTEAQGAELWVTDGTAAGTSLVKDINPGAASSTPRAFYPTTISGQPGAYFIAETEANGSELWVTDGTAGGTFMLKDVSPGADSGIDGSFGGLPQIITIAGSSFVFFAANDGVSGNELWVSDGTSLNTVRVADINPGAASSNPHDFKFFPSLPFVFLSATNSATGTEIYAANLTTATLVHDIVPGVGSSDPKEYAITPSSIVFAAENAASGREAWYTNLTTPNVLADVVPGSADSIAMNFMQLSGTQVLYSSIGTGSLPYQTKFMSTDGTPGGTSSIASLGCLPGGISSIYLGSTVKSHYILNGHAIFPCLDILTQKSELWVSDGTAPTTHILRDFIPSVFTYFGDSFTMLGGNNKVIFNANDGIKGNEPWVTDGTTPGTSLLADLNPGEASSIDPLFGYLSLFSQQENTTASLLPVTIGLSRKVYYTDGSLANTREIFDDSRSGTDSSTPDYFASLGNKVIFSAVDTNKGREPFITDGKASGTKLLKNLFKAGNSDPVDFQTFDSNRNLFVAANSAKGKELWITDGTKPGTKLVKDIRVGRNDSNIELFKGKARGKTFFRADDGVNGAELWVTKGTKASTKLVKDIRPGIDSAYPDELVVVNGKAIFSASDGVNGSELWISNGTAAGTTLLKDINPGSASSSPSDLVVAGNKVFFDAYNAASGSEIWVTDGTPAGTVQVKDIIIGSGSSDPDRLVVVGGILFFTAQDALNGNELWRSDGTNAGTFMIQNISPGAGGSSISKIVPLSGSQVAFIANDGVHGVELWTANSSAGSATLVSDLVPGINGSNPSDLYGIPSRGLVAFSATTTGIGSEPWLSNGTAAGTSLLADVSVGADSSYPYHFFAKGRKLYFAASTDATSTEPYVVKIP